MKQHTRIFALILSITLTVATFTGCSAFVTMPPVSGPSTGETAAENRSVDKPSSEGADTTISSIGDEKGDETDEIPLEVTCTEWTLLPGKDTETAVYKYVTNRPGPKIIIVGGTHGDETAGWTTALELKDAFDAQTVDGMCGEILLIPQLCIIADEVGKRYVSNYNGIDYSDLNRAFPIERADGVAEATVELAEACIETIRTFIGEDFQVVTDQEGLTTNLCIIDLHESRGAQSDGYLGSDLIYTNCAFLMESFLSYYNSTYRKTGEAKFVHDEANKSGSFSMYFSETYPDAVVFTVETNRQVSDGSDTIALTTRTRQQHDILNTLFDMVWNRVDKTAFD